jgi:hypothetical protein
MKQEFSASIVRKCIFTLLILIYPVYATVTAWPVLAPTTIAFDGIMLLLCGYFLLLFRRKIIIDDDGKKIIIVGVFRTRELPFALIKGFTQRNLNRYRMIYIIPRSPDHQSVRIDGYFPKFTALVERLGESITDIDSLERNKNKQRILDDKKFGDTATEREEHLDTAKMIIKTITFVSVAAGICLIIYPIAGYAVQDLRFLTKAFSSNDIPAYFIALVVLCSVMPMVVIFVYRSYHGLAILHVEKNSDRPNLFNAWFMPSFALAMTAKAFGINFTIVNYNYYWKPAVLILIITGLLVLYDSGLSFNIREPVTQQAIGIILLLGALYGYGLILSTNFIFSRHQYAVYPSKILDKRSYHSARRGDSYYFYISGWEHHPEKDEISVTGRTYELKKKGDPVMIRYYTGMFGIPYYRVDKDM